MDNRSMRPVLRKISDRVPLAPREFRQLIDYVEHVRAHGEASYQVFRQNYGSVLYELYGIYLSRFGTGRAELAEFLFANPGVARTLRGTPLPVNAFPTRFRGYLREEYGESLQPSDVEDILRWLPGDKDKDAGLPREREQEPVLVYEAGNPGKEWGLQQHFERIARHRFVTRVVSVRYLARGKAKKDRFEVRGDDVLGGIFTNREKSIYFMVYLTEAEPSKTANACQLLNLVFYG